MKARDLKLWYDRAFGPLMNWMEISLEFFYDKKDNIKTQATFLAELEYTMFPEI